jgi:serine protease Do
MDSSFRSMIQLTISKLTMKTLTTLAVLALVSLTALAQPSVPAPPPAPASAPNPPTPPLLPPRGHDRDRDREPKVPVTFLGVETSHVPGVVCEQLGLTKGFGLVVDYVVPDGPAATAGVQQNDIIKMLNDQILTDPDQLGKLVRSYSEGTSVTLTLLRKGQEQKVTVKLGKKEVSRRHAMLGNGNWNFDFGDMGDFGEMKDRMREQMSQLKDQLGQLNDENKGMIHDAVIRARDEARRAVEEARRTAGQVRTITRDDGTLAQTTIDLGKAQIVFSDDKGELRIENKDGKKLLTAKDPQGKLLFSGPVETKEDLDKVPTEVRQRYDKLQQHDLPAVSPDDLRASGDNDADDDDDSDDEEDSGNATTASYEQVSNHSFGASWIRFALA